jgi:hypothetical protein
MAVHRESSYAIYRTCDVVSHNKGVRETGLVPLESGVFWPTALPPRRYVPFYVLSKTDES